MNCDDARLALGALVIGALDIDEAATVRSHLTDCADCPAEYEELRQMPRLLGLVTLDEATQGPTVAPTRLRDDLIQRTVEVRRGERRRHVAWIAAGGLAVAAVAAAVGFGLAEATSATEPVDPGQVLSATDATTGVSGQVSVDGVGWGTKLGLEVAGVTAGETCSLVAVSSTGSREVTATWTVPAAIASDKYLTVPGAAGLQPDSIDTFEVVTTTGATLLILSFADLVS